MLAGAGIVVAVFVVLFICAAVMYFSCYYSPADATSTVLQNCATDSTKFFMLTSANQIVTTFNSIGTSLSQLRVAR